MRLTCNYNLINHQQLNHLKFTIQQKIVTRLLVHEVVTMSMSLLTSLSFHGCYWVTLIYHLCCWWTCLCYGIRILYMYRSMSQVSREDTGTLLLLFVSALDLRRLPYLGVIALEWADWPTLQCCDLVSP